MLLLATKFSQLSSWYLVFSEFPDLNDASIAQFVKVTDAIDAIHDHSLRGNAMGVFQANLGLWQILARQGEFRDTDLNQSWQQAIAPFAAINSSAQLFDAGQASLGTLMLAASGKSGLSQSEFVELLAGPPQQSADGSTYPRRNGRQNTGGARRSETGVAGYACSHWATALRVWRRERPRAAT